MAYKDGETFTTYCDKAYDRHTYKLNMKNGDAYLFEDYEVLRAAWWAKVELVHSVEVLDAPGQGF
jgi:hypothetical protein